jgi:methoxymalonate biosynthesis acyl carrier protein
MTPNHEAAERTALDFLNRYFGTDDLAADDDIFALGLANSLFALELILFVEKAFGIHVDDEDLELANFRSARAMAGLATRKRAAPVSD